jgi:hypothetical protein
MQDAAVGINSIDKHGAVNVYPNPDSDRISLASMNSGAMLITIYTVTEQILLLKEFPAFAMKLISANYRPAFIY